MRASTVASPWFDVNAAAAYAGVSTPTIKRAALTGRLRGYKIGGRRLWRFRADDLDSWITSSGTPVPFVAARRGAA